MKNISTEVDYFSSTSKSDVCRDGNSLLTLVTGVGEEINGGKPLNIGLMATSESTIINKSDELSLLKGGSASAAVTSNGCKCGDHPNGVALPHQLQHLTNTWPWRLHTHQQHNVGIPRNIDHNVGKVNLDVNHQHNGHSVGCCNEDNFAACGLTKARKMVRSASMDNLDSPDKYRHKPHNGGSDLCEVLGVEEPPESKVNDDLSGLYRRASDPLNTSRPRPLNAVLESIPLAYNPQTKQLHLLKPKPTQHVECNGEDFDSCPGAGKLDHWPVHNAGTATSTAGKCNGNGGKSDSSGFSTENAHHHALLQRVSTCGSLQSKADCSSFSSISSLCTDLSTASALEDNYNNDALFGRDGDEANFIEINLNPHHHHQRNRSSDGLLNHDDGRGSLDEQCSPGQGAKSKRRGLSDFLTRNILAWRSSRESSNVGASDEAPGWKLFSKSASAAPSRPPTQRDPNRIIEEYHERQCQLNGGDCPSECSTPRSKRSDELVASSTTALILENRPSNLPSKAPEEEVKHRLEYQQMVEAAKKKEIKEAKLKKKLAQQQLRHEEQLSQAAKCWNVEILPNWETAKFCRKAKKMWWQGIPPSVRGKVWKLAIGNDLHITHELYEICVCRAKDRIRMAAESISVSEDDFEENLQDKEGSVELIKLDVSRTFPQLCIFQKRGPYYDMLHSLLGAYVCYRPDVGYVQGMSFLAAVLILNLEVADAFICFANLMNKPCQLAFFRLDEQMMKSYFLTYEEYFSENLPKLFNHFSKQNLTPDLYLIDWIYTLYSRSLHLDVACRVWDVYFRDGDEFLFRTALGILRLYDDILLNMEFIHLAQFLTKLPEDIGADQLFKSIESIRMVIDKRSFAQVLQSYSEPKQT